MIRSLLLCVVIAALLHLAVLLFGGAVKFLFVKPSAPEAEKLQEVEVVEEKKEEKPQEKKQVEKVAKAEEEPLPDTSVIEAIEQQQAAPALAQVSLADLESALGSGGAGGGGGFNFASGGVIGGTGAPGSDGVDALMGGGGTMSKPRVVSSQQPDFPAAIKRKGGSVALVVWVGADGRVRKVSVESASDPALEQPAIEAVQRWMFEPAIYQGRKVPGKVRQVIRLSPSGT
jgi:protein TonB